MSSQLWAKLSVRVTKSARRLAYPGRVVLSVLLVSLPFGFVLCVVAGGASFYSSSASVGLAAAGVAISVVGLLTSIILGTMALRRNRDVDRDLVVIEHGSCVDECVCLCVAPRSSVLIVCCVMCVGYRPLRLASLWLSLSAFLCVVRVPAVTRAGRGPRVCHSVSVTALYL